MFKIHNERYRQNQTADRHPLNSPSNAKDLEPLDSAPTLLLKEKKKSITIKIFRKKL